MDKNIFEIDIKALRDNICILKNYTNTKLCLPIKANAYGHGLDVVVRYTHDIVDFYATSSAREALSVFKYSLNIPVLILGFVEDTYIKELVEKDVRFTIHSLFDIDKFESYAKEFSKNIKVHLFINTGMNISGVDYTKAKDAINRINNSKYINLEGVYSHLACADEKDHPFNKFQIDKFQSIVDYVKNIDIDIICHLANSYGSIGQKNISYDMIRPGILSYGFLPKFSIVESLKEIKPIGKLLAPIVKIIKLSDFTKVGYAITYEGELDEQIAILPIGYGDGIFRKMGNHGYVYIGDNPYKIVGRVNMDALSVSLGDNQYSVKVGDQAELISNLPNRKNSVKNIAKFLDTIEYEIITSINKRVMRRII